MYVRFVRGFLYVYVHCMDVFSMKFYQIMIYIEQMHTWYSLLDFYPFHRCIDRTIDLVELIIFSILNQWKLIRRVIVYIFPNKICINFIKCLLLFEFQFYQWRINRSRVFLSVSLDGVCNSTETDFISFSFPLLTSLEFQPIARV